MIWSFSARTTAIAAFCLLFFVSPVLAATPAELVPSPYGLPVPWGILKVLLLLTFFIHIILVNILIGSSIMALINAFRFQPFSAGNLARETSFVPSILALTVNFGVAPYLFLQVLYSGFLYSSSVLMAVWWLSVIALAMLAYYGLYIMNYGGSDGIFAKRLLLSLVTIMLLAVAFFLCTNNTLMLRPDRWFRWADHPGGTLLNLGDPTFIPRYLHIILASAAVGGLVLAFRGALSKRNPYADPEEADERIRRGLRWFFHVSIVQALAGIWFLLALPAPVRNLFLGGSGVATAGIILALIGLICALFFARKRKVRSTCGAVLGTILIMVCLRDIARDAMLTPYLPPAPGAPEIKALPIISGQYGALALFLVCAIIAVLAVVWLARVALRTFREARALGTQEE